MDPGETWIHEKEVLTKQILLLIYYIYYIVWGDILVVAFKL